jgi:hypothetical protein
MRSVSFQGPRSDPSRSAPASAPHAPGSPYWCNDSRIRWVTSKGAATPLFARSSDPAVVRASLLPYSSRDHRLDQVSAQSAIDLYSVTVLGGVQDALAPLGGCAVLDPACAR